MIRPEERRVLKWVAFGVVLFLVGVIVLVVVSNL